MLKLKKVFKKSKSDHPKVKLPYIAGDLSSFKSNRIISLHNKWKSYEELSLSGNN